MVRIKHAQDDRKHDLYETPPEATRALLGAERLPKGLWEPHCGRGAIAEVLFDAGHSVACTDLKDRGYPYQVATGSFLEMEQCPQGVEGIVMNPPYTDAAIHVRHALGLCPYVCALLRLSFLEAGNDKTDAGRARLFCLDRGHLARVHVFKNRLPMMHRDGWEGPRATNTVAFAWFVFDRFHRGAPTIHRISWS